MDLKTHVIETPIEKHKVEVRDFLLGGEKRKMVNETDPANQQNLLITTLCISIDGKSDNVVAALDGMHGKDFDFVLFDLAKVAEDSSLPSEKKVS